MDDSRIKDWIAVALEIGVSVASLWLILRMLGGPDAARLARARFAKSGESFCQSQAVAWARLADRCSRAYDATRATTRV